ncbi:MAG: serine/threonine-protein kinase, partial [Myxococcota bacterium]
MSSEDDVQRTVADRYILGQLIGRGGMGAVYFAQHRLTGETLALKLIQPGGADPQLLLERFRREVSVASRIGHPGIVRVQDAGQERNGDIFVVMELLRGRDLHHYMHDEAFELRGGVFVLRSALEPLAAAHAAGIVHRDLKPQNVFLHKAPEGLQIKLLDFGIARDLEAAEGLTATNVSLGTPQYISPEQATQARQVGPPADVWAIGVTLYQMIAGHPPFDGKTAFTVLKAACEETPPELRPSTALGERLVSVVEACLRKSPAERPQDARELAQLLDLALGSSSPAVPPLPSPDATQAELSLEVPRRRRWPLLLVLLMLVLPAATGAVLWTSQKARLRLPQVAPLPPPAAPEPAPRDRECTRLNSTHP